MKFFILFLMGVMAGSMITIQSVLNSALGKKTGNLGSVLVLTIVSIAVLILLIALFPDTANLRRIPGLAEWYLYAGGVLGIIILAAPIFLIPRIGATSTLTALVVGQLVLALVMDQFGLFGIPKIEINLIRIMGLILLVAGALLIKQ
ncbi:MAG: DMT family transporter [Anaerolineales bacterium]|nr:DMT family transporter [Anaerolineales bacterium]